MTWPQSRKGQALPVDLSNQQKWSAVTCALQLSTVQ